MRFSLCFVLLCAISVTTGIRVKRGLTADEQKKFLDALNEDRQALGKKMNLTFEILTYDVTLEKEVETSKCKNRADLSVVPLKMNSILKEELRGEETYFSRRLFLPDRTKIGCSKEKMCSDTIEDGELKGKIAKRWGACILTPDHAYSFFPNNTPEKAGMPSFEKYGDLLGVVGDPDTEENSSVNTFLISCIGTEIIELTVDSVWFFLLQAGNGFSVARRQNQNFGFLINVAPQIHVIPTKLYFLG
ncbi:hypothetical protein B9Z55_008786 [Caenorhabditis nigoni]|uniref:Uncharacterized protein n=1 Tax=Caenorhabditis nigoni TaxID=1611254 RepID=A0A2G5UPB1_9PELO|nr:hypothetical protein B9Z55_008786 [Caenorhabditis nigoni]